MKTPTMMKRLLIPGLAVALGLSFLASTAKAVPYASGITKDGNTVSFVLNHDAAGLVVLRDGGNPVYPGTTAGVLSFDMTGHTSYQIIVTGNTAAGWAQYVPDGADRNFEYPFGVSINKNPASTNFGKAYVSNARIGTTVAGRGCQDGIYLLRADGVDLGFKDGGRTWAGNSAPYRTTIGPDGHLYVSDLANDLAFEFNEDMTAVTQLIDASNRTVGQWVHSVYVTGTQAGGDRKLYLVNGNYLDGRRGLIMYDLGANATVAPDDLGTQVIGPSYYTYYPLDVARDSEGYWYLNQYRAATGQAPAIDKFDSAIVPNNTPVWSTTRNYPYTWGLDIYEPGKLAAVGQASGGNIYIFSMATGDFLESFVAGSAPRELAFDAAGNMVTVDNSLEWVRFWSPGGYTIAITSWDGANAAFEVIKPFNEVSVTATDPIASEAGPDTGTFTITRTGSTSEPLTVNYTLSGTASNGEDYTEMSGTVVIPANESSVDVVVTPIDDSVAELTETVILTLATSENYAVASPSSATVVIADNETPLLQIVSLSTNIYERLQHDYARLTIRRLGNTNDFLQLEESNFALSGTAVKDTDYTLTYLMPHYIDMGVVNTSLELIYPIDNTAVDGPRTVTVGLLAGSGYTVATNTATTIITDDDRPAEDVLFLETFSFEDGLTNWLVYYADTNTVAPANDASILFAYDYSWLGVPAAPNSDNDTYGLLLQVNKQDPVPGAAAVNLYPKNKTFSGDYALRFDMYLIVGTVATTEYSLFGINHSGTKTNWFRNSAGGVPAGWTFDGLFYGVETDAGALGDYVLYSSPTTAGNNPTPQTPGRNASTLTQVFKAPPFRYAGAPSNPGNSSTPSWVDVEVSQVGQLVTLKMNNIVIFSYTNATPHTSGNIMLGLVDAYDSIGTDAAAAVVFDNVRVVDLTLPTVILTQVKLVGGNVEIDFTGPAADAPSAFVLQEASVVNGTYADVVPPATITGSGGSYKAVVGAGTSPKFYRIKRP